MEMGGGSARRRATACRAWLLMYALLTAAPSACHLALFSPLGGGPAVYAALAADRETCLGCVGATALVAMVQWARYMPSAPLAAYTVSLPLTTMLARALASAVARRGAPSTHEWLRLSSRLSLGHGLALIILFAALHSRTLATDLAAPEVHECVVAILGWSAPLALSGVQLGYACLLYGALALCRSLLLGALAGAVVTLMAGLWAAAAIVGLGGHTSRGLLVLLVADAVVLCSVLFVAVVAGGSGKGEGEDEGGDLADLRTRADTAESDSDKSWASAPADTDEDSTPPRPPRPPPPPPPQPLPLVELQRGVRALSRGRHSDWLWAALIVSPAAPLLATFAAAHALYVTGAH
ncbi:hypothetical protein T492DRAFT_868812 [Pavlovales sp. CCMP2436]|nr:hypothetical protein T492DRAFT_868812 [Pavlovales sp. CCMP2436]